MRSTLAVPSLPGLALLLAPAIASAAVADPLATLFPTDTLAYVRVPGAAALGQTAAGARLWSKPTVVAAEIERLASLICLSDGEALGLGADQAKEVRSAVRQVSLAWMPAAKGRPIVAGAVLLSQAAVGADLIGAAQAQGLLRPVKLAGKPAFELAVAGFPAVLFQVGPALVVCPDHARAAAMLAQPKANLSTHPAFQKALGEPAAVAPLWAWADLARARPFWLTSLAGPVGTAWDALAAGLGVETGTVAVGFGGPEPLSRLTTIRLWGGQAASLPARLSGGRGVSKLADLIPVSSEFMVWGSAVKLAGAWPLVVQAMGRVEAASKSKPFTTLVEQFETAGKLPVATLLADVEEFALFVLRAERREPAEQRTVLAVRLTSAGAAAALMKRLDAAALAATSQPARRTTIKGTPMGQWLSRAARPVGAYLVQGSTVFLATRPDPLAEVARQSKAGWTLAKKSNLAFLLNGTGPQDLVVLTRTDRFLDASPDLAGVGQLISPSLPAIWLARFRPDGPQLQTNLPIPLLVLLAATATVE